MSVGPGDNEALPKMARGARGGWRGPREDLEVIIHGAVEAPGLSQTSSQGTLCSPNFAHAPQLRDLLLHHPLPPRTNPAPQLGSAPSQPARRHQGWFFTFPLGIPHRERGFGGPMDPLVQLLGVSSFTPGTGRQCRHTHTDPLSPPPQGPRLSSHLQALPGITRDTSSPSPWHSPAWARAAAPSRQQRDGSRQAGAVWGCSSSCRQHGWRMPFGQEQPGFFSNPSQEKKQQPKPHNKL